MTVKNLLERYRGLEYELTIEFRENNYFVKSEKINNIKSIDERFKDKEIDNWFIVNDKEIVIDL